MQQEANYSSVHFGQLFQHVNRCAEYSKRMPVEDTNYIPPGVIYIDTPSVVHILSFLMNSRMTLLLLPSASENQLNFPSLLVERKLAKAQSSYHECCILVEYRSWDVTNVFQGWDSQSSVVK